MSGFPPDADTYLGRNETLMRDTSPEFPELFPWAALVGIQDTVLNRLASEALLTPPNTHEFG